MQIYSRYVLELTPEHLQHGGHIVGGTPSMQFADSIHWGRRVQIQGVVWCIEQDHFLH